MEKQNAVFIGVVVIIVTIALGLSYMNGLMFSAVVQPGDQADTSNHIFRVEVVSGGNYLTFRYIPSVSMTGPVTAMYQAKNETSTLFSDKKIFGSVTPDNPIEIAMKKSDNGTYTMTMMISDKRNSIVYTGNTMWYGSNATFFTTPLSLNATARP